MSKRTLARNHNKKTWLRERTKVGAEYGKYLHKQRMLRIRKMTNEHYGSNPQLDYVQDAPDYTEPELPCFFCSEELSGSTVVSTSIPVPNTNNELDTDMIVSLCIGCFIDATNEGQAVKQEIIDVYRESMQVY